MICFFGRPRGRSVVSNPNDAAVFWTQRSPPKGRPRSTLRRRAASSPSVCGRFTSSTQRDGQGTGQRLSKAASSGLPACRRHRLHQRQLLPAVRGPRERVALDVSANGEKVVVLLDHEGLEASLVEVTAAGIVMMGVPTLGVRQRQPVHEAREQAVLLGPEH